MAGVTLEGLLPPGHWMRQIHRRTQELVGVSKIVLGRGGSMLLCKVWLSRLGGLGRNGPCQLFCSCCILKISAPPAQVLRLVNKSVSR